MNNLQIKETNVEIETDIVFKAIEVGYRGSLFINSNLPNDYLVQKGSNKIIILKFNKSTDLHLDLFSYDGACNITYAKIVDENLNYHSLNIKKPTLLTWDNITTNWDDLGTNWDDLKNTQRNDFRETVKYKTVNGEKKKTIEIVRNTSNNKKDRNIKVLGNLYTSGSKYKIKSNNTPYTGNYHIYTKTLKIMTGSEPNKQSKQLIKLNINKDTNNLMNNKENYGYK